VLPWFQNNQFPLYLAPMAGFTDIVFRHLCKQQGADVLVSEFVMSDSVNLGHPMVWETIDFTEEQRPMGIQIFGNEPNSMIRAARTIVDHSNPDFIDLNFGCPSEKVTCQAAGASLLRTPDRLVEIAAAVAKNLPQTPITAKIRLGWDKDSIVADEIALRLQDAGIRAITIHGRTKVQGYSGEADWERIFSIAEKVEIPVVGNGNIINSTQVYEIRRHSKVKGVMIGRGALGYPWIFSEIKQHLTTGTIPSPPTLTERWDTILNYANLLAARERRKNESESIAWMRTKLIKLTKDMLGCKKLRHELVQIDKLEDIPPIASRHIETYRENELELQSRLNHARRHRQAGQ